MNECSTNLTQHFTSCASLAAIGVKVKQLKLFDPMRTRVHIKQKVIKHTPADKLYDAFISLLAGTHGLVEINTRLRTDSGLQRAFGRTACAEQSVVQETLDACAEENVPNCNKRSMRSFSSRVKVFAMILRRVFCCWMSI